MVEWSLNTSEDQLENVTDFFKSSDIVIVNENIIFSTGSAIYSYNINNGYTNWKNKVSSIFYFCYIMNHIIHFRLETDLNVMSICTL